MASSACLLLARTDSEIQIDAIIERFVLIVFFDKTLFCFRSALV